MLNRDSCRSAIYLADSFGGMFFAVLPRCARTPERGSAADRSVVGGRIIWRHDSLISKGEKNRAVRRRLAFSLSVLLTASAAAQDSCSLAGLPDVSDRPDLSHRLSDRLRAAAIHRLSHRVRNRLRRAAGDHLPTRLGNGRPREPLHGRPAGDGNRRARRGLHGPASGLRDGRARRDLYGDAAGLRDGLSNRVPHGAAAGDDLPDAVRRSRLFRRADGDEAQSGRPRG